MASGPTRVGPLGGTRNANHRPSAHEERELFAAYEREGRSVEARNRIVERYAFVADHHVARFGRWGAEADDLRQVAMISILRAVDRFDASKGASFATFADRTVEGECKRYLRDRSWLVRPPRRLHDAHLRVRRVVDDLALQSGRSPTVAELAEELGWTEEEVLEALEVTELRQPVTADAVREHDLGVDDGVVDGVERSNDRVVLRQAIECLDDDMKELVFLRYYGDASQVELAERYGVSQSYLSRMIRRSLDDVRRHAFSQAESSGGVGQRSRT
jgi:RNA polymerase sigma-B factor